MITQKCAIKKESQIVINEEDKTLILKNLLKRYNVSEEEELQSDIGIKIELFNKYFYKFCRKMMRISREMIKINKKTNELDKVNSKFKELNDNWNEIDQIFNELNNINNNIEDFDHKIIEEKTLLLENLIEKCKCLEKDLKIDTTIFYRF